MYCFTRPSWKPALLSMLAWLNKNILQLLLQLLSGQGKVKSFKPSNNRLESATPVNKERVAPMRQRRRVQYRANFHALRRTARCHASDVKLAWDGARWTYFGKDDVFHIVESKKPYRQKLWMDRLTIGQKAGTNATVSGFTNVTTSQRKGCSYLPVQPTTIWLNVTCSTQRRRPGFLTGEAAPSSGRLENVDGQCTQGSRGVRMQWVGVHHSLAATVFCLIVFQRYNLTLTT